MYHICIIGHSRHIDKIKEVIKDYFPDISATSIVLTNMAGFNKTIKYLKEHEDDIDGVLFTGKIPYDIMNHAMHSHNPWTYIEHNRSQLQRTLLELSFEKNYDFLNISIDSLDESTVNNAYKEIGIDKSRLRAFFSEMTIFQATFLDDLLTFHIKNYKENGVSFCITGVSKIYESLQKEKIPSVLLVPTEDTLKQTIHLLKQKMGSGSRNDSQIIVIAVEIDLKSEYTLTNENEYQMMLEKTKVTEEIYRFAQRIQAAVIEEGSRNYLLFTTKRLIEFETKNMQQISLLSFIEKNTINTISVGIGYGTTAREAKYHALLGMNKATKIDSNYAYVVYSPNNIERLKSPLQSENNTTEIFDITYKIISDKTGISINTIYKLRCIKDIAKKDYFTSSELAKEFGNSLRSMNRIIEKLEIAGYVEIVGKKIVKDAGRPSRILKLLF